MVVLAVAGCGSGGVPITPTQFCNEFAQAVCDAVASACLVTHTACTSVQVTQCTANQVRAAAAGRDFLPPNAEACLSKVRDVYGKLNQGAVALQAADVLAMDSTCSDTYRGSEVAFGPCSIDQDCVDGLICDKGFCGTSTTKAAGAQCANVGETCPQGFYCGATTSGVLVCEAKLGVQAACDDANPCLEDLRCAGGVCAEQLGVGEACTSNQDCSTGFCEPYARKCANDIRFANGSAACLALGG